MPASSFDLFQVLCSSTNNEIMDLNSSQKSTGQGAPDENSQQCVGSERRVKKRRNYTEDSAKDAADAVRAKVMTYGEASKQFGVPKSTIRFRLGGNWSGKIRPGPGTTLTSEEEKKVVLWVKELEKRGFPCTKQAIKAKVNAFLEADSRQTVFKNTIPGHKWFSLFIKRHPELSIRKPESVTRAAANVSETDIRSWFAQIHKYFEDRGLSDILKDPRRVLNADETMFLFDPVTKSVVATKGNRNVYLVQQAEAKKNLTVMFTFDASGFMFPPDIILPLKRLSKQLLMSFQPDWGIGRSERGWMDRDNFLPYIKNIVYPTLVQRQVPFPVVLFVDGHSSHTGIEAAEMCAELGIILVALFPNATHIIQPADVAMFKPLKNSWTHCVDRWKLSNHGKNFTMESFGPLLHEAIETGIKPETIKAGFRKCGLFPFDPDQIDYSRCLAKSTLAPTGTVEKPEESLIEEAVLVNTSKLKNCLNVIRSHRIEKIKSTAASETVDSVDSEEVIAYIYREILAEYDDGGNSRAFLGESLIMEDVGMETCEPAETNLSDDGNQNSRLCDDYVAPPIVLSREIPDPENYSFSDDGRDYSNVTRSDEVVTEQVDRRLSITPFLNIPPTPKRKMTKRVYSQKRHFILTSSEHLKELNKKEEQKEELARKKQKLSEERALKKQQKENEKELRKNVKKEKQKSKNTSKRATKSQL